MANLYLSYLDGGKSNQEALYRLFNKIAGSSNSGVIGTSDFQVIQNGTPDMNVLVGTGDIVIPYQGYFFHGWCTSQQTVAIGANSSGNPRIDAIVAYADLTTSPSSAVTNNLDYLKLLRVAGTPGASPSAPDNTAIQTAVGASNVFHRLANVTVANGATSIVTANISDQRSVFVLGVGPATANTLTNKIYSKMVAVNEHDAGNSSTAITINWANADRQKVAMTGNATISFSNATEGQVLTLWLKQDATGGRTISFGSTIKWPGGSAPSFSTAANAIDVVVIRFDGTNYYGQFGLGFA